MLYNPHHKDSSDEEGPHIVHVAWGPYADVKGVFWMPFESYFKSFHVTTIHGLGDSRGDRIGSVEGETMGGEGAWTRWQQNGDRLATLDNFDAIKRTDADTIFNGELSVCGVSDERFEDKCGPDGDWHSTSYSVLLKAGTQVVFTFDAQGVVDDQRKAVVDIYAGPTVAPWNHSFKGSPNRLKKRRGNAPKSKS